jgi:hypothetical protein
VPTNRTPRDRHRKPRIDDETLALFVELEAAPPRRRESDSFKAQDKELHQRLGLWGERLCSQVSVLDRREEHHRPGSPQAADTTRRPHSCGHPAGYRTITRSDLQTPSQCDATFFHVPERRVIVLRCKRCHARATFRLCRVVEEVFRCHWIILWHTCCFGTALQRAVERGVSTIKPEE